jgi:ubiquinol-cytochrome c reductase cytochrome c1 subunit
MKALSICVPFVGIVLAKDKESNKVHAWMYRDDIGAFWGIKGYEE